LPGILVSQMGTQVAVGKAADDELTAEEKAKQRRVILTEEIEAFVAMVVILLGFGQIVELFHTGLRRLDRRDELEVARVDGLQCLGKGR